MGSKAKITKYIVPIIQRKIDESGARYYVEPFAGGCNVIDKITHLYLTQVLNDNIPMQRRQGLKAGRDILNACDTIIIGARHGISEGMAAEINAAAGKHQIIVI